MHDDAGTSGTGCSEVLCCKWFRNLIGNQYEPRFRLNCKEIEIDTRRVLFLKFSLGMFWYQKIMNRPAHLKIDLLIKEYRRFQTTLDKRSVHHRKMENWFWLIAKRRVPKEQVPNTSDTVLSEEVEVQSREMKGCSKFYWWSFRNQHFELFSSVFCHMITQCLCHFVKVFFYHSIRKTGIQGNAQSRERLNWNHTGWTSEKELPTTGC